MGKLADEQDRQPLTDQQRETAAQLLWYREWLLSTGRTEKEIDGR